MRRHQVQFITTLTLVAAVMLSTSCTSPQLTRRYAAAEFPPGETASTEVALSLFAMDVPAASTQTTVLSLGERAQAALIKELSTKVTDARALLNALASPITKPTPPERVIDRTIVDRRVIMSIDNQSLRPSTRIHKATIILSLETPAGATSSVTPAAFKSWSQFTTKYQTVNLGSVTFTQGNEVGLGVKAAPPQIPTLEGTGQVRATRNMEESLSIHPRYVETTGVLTPKEARLVQEGAFGIDLSGNMIVDVTISVGSPAAGDHDFIDIFTFARLFDPTGKPNPAGTIEIDTQTIKFVKATACQPVQAKAELRATLRQVQGGDQTLMEGDDKALYPQIIATMQHQDKERGFELVPAEALRVSVWYIANARPSRLHVTRASGHEEALFFGSFDEANEFLLYLRALPGNSLPPVGGRPLSLDEKPLSKHELQGLQVERQRLNWEKFGCSLQPQVTGGLVPSTNVPQPSMKQDVP
jgi:hypothetical protein